MKLKLLSMITCAIMLQNCSKSPDAPQSALHENGKDSGSTTMAGCFSNPVIATAGGDPYCFKYNNKYYMYRPSNHDVILNTSTDLVNWSAASVMFTHTSDVWAPEVHKIGVDFYLYFAVPQGLNGGRDIMVCKLTSPTSAGSNIASTLVGATSDEINIDPTVYAEGSNCYLLWKNKGTGNSQVCIRQLNASNPKQFASGSSRSILFPDIPANPINKEHPTLIREGYGTNQWRYYLFFDSGVGETAGYKIEHATSGSLTGTFTYQGILMQQDASINVYSIGGQSIVRDGSNYRWMVYRAKNTSATGWADRKPCIDRLFIDATAGTATCVPTSTGSTYCPVPL
jgi:beta-xylosidase